MPLRGDVRVDEPGFTYVPRFISQADAVELVDYFGSLHPVWESRYAEGDTRNRGSKSRLTRPVYWLGAWQFAGLGYYAPPTHVQDRCVRAEPFPPVFERVLEAMAPILTAHGDTDVPNTCLINYYGSERLNPSGPPVDYARLRLHRDAEPGAVAMFSIGQPAQFEFAMPDATEPEHSQWVRNRSIVVISGDEYKDRLYHRITRVRHGQDPVLTTPLHAFHVRRVSVSFRHVPESAITDAHELAPQAQAVALPYIQRLAASSTHWRHQLESMDAARTSTAERNTSSR